ncbi:ALA-interacting subunit 5-like, partial [Panicum virgatum]|uniref:ALA-interacting subunit 5-like n=1 Tax=Panicum virgatum TaxID=38727 RepID=UPI0019D5F639
TEAKLGLFTSLFRYARSRNIRQLRDPRSAKDTGRCKPEATANGIPIVPCGLVAWSLFNDTCSFARGNETLAVNKRGISWRSERDHLFSKHVYPRNFQSGGLIGCGTLDPSKPLSEQEDLMVWMRTAALPKFRKLYGTIEVDLRAGEVVTVAVQNRYNTYSFGGRKAVVLSTAGALGGKSSFLGRAYLAGGAACLGLALLLTLLGLFCPFPV